MIGGLVTSIWYDLIEEYDWWWNMIERCRESLQMERLSITLMYPQLS